MSVTEADIREAWKRVEAWEETERAEDGQFDCPLCNTDGYLDGVRYDATAVHPATLVGYGIGKGLADAETLAAAVPVLLEALDKARGGLQAVEELTRTLYEGVQAGAGCCGPAIGKGSRLRQVLDRIEEVKSGEHAKSVESRLEEAWAERDEAKASVVRLRQALTRVFNGNGEEHSFCFKEDCGTCDECFARQVLKETNP